MVIFLGRIFSCCRMVVSWLFRERIGGELGVGKEKVVLVVKK